MKSGKKRRKWPEGLENRLLTVCRFLNEQRAKYLVVGGYACNLHGLIRATRDVDLLIPPDKHNAGKVLEALGRLPLRLANELDPGEVARKPITIVGDMPRVDVLTVAGKITFAKAIKSARKVRIQGVLVPFVDADILLATKETDRLQDRADSERLKEIMRSE